jgi:hypothetical protein
MSIIYIVKNNNLHWFVVYCNFRFEIFEKNGKIIFSCNKLKPYNTMTFIEIGETNINLFNMFILEKQLQKNQETIVFYIMIVNHSV